MRKKIEEILEKGIENKEELSIEEIKELSDIEDKEELELLFNTAREIKKNIYGKRIVMFAPLYISNVCSNECVYCAFRKRNESIIRKTLTLDEIRKETEFLISEGHKRILCVSSEISGSIEYIADAIKTIYNTRIENERITRINVNIAPLSLEEFKILKECKIGTYQLFQETYNRETYKKVHIEGKKADFGWRLNAIDRAIESGIEDVGIGVLLGLYDWKEELVSIIEHSRRLMNKFGIGPHTISIPRIEPASGSIISEEPPNRVSDIDFKKIIAILRIAVPYTGIILSTREDVNLRREAMEIGVSQVSAGSRTNPGGYGESGSTEQFSLGDHRTLEEVVYDIMSQGYIPSFCTECYKKGRVGTRFMDLAKSGHIKKFCSINAIVTLKEFLLRHCSKKTQELGMKLIDAQAVNRG